MDEKTRIGVDIGKDSRSSTPGRSSSEAADMYEDPYENFTFKCAHCKFETKWKQNLGRHMKIHKGTFIVGAE